jgi:selenoprotein W-related protein
LTAEILQERPIEQFIDSWKLIPTKGGVFEITINGELIFSKKALNRHAEPGEVRELILKKLDEVRGSPPSTNHLPDPE